MTGRTVRQAIAAVALWFPAAGAGAASLDEAARALDSGDYGRAVSEAGPLTRQQSVPRQRDAWRILARALALTGNYARALAAYRQVLAPDAVPDLPAQVAAADIETVLGDADAARARLEHVVGAWNAQGDALSGSALIAVGDAFRRLARDDPALYHTALQVYEAAIRRAPGDPATHVAIGDLLLDRYNNTEAVQAFRAALAIDGDYVPALFGLARSQRFDYSPAAEQTARRVLRLQPHFVPARLMLARLLIDSEHYSEAERQIRRALGVNPHSPEALTALAAVYYLRDEHARFDAQIEEIRRGAPGYSRVFETLAEIAGRNRRYRDAQAFARRELELDPRAWRGYALIGENDLRLGDMNAGRRSLETAFRGDPYDVRTKNTLDLLDRLQDFETVHSGRFVLVAAPGEAEVLAPRLLPIAEQAYDYYAARYGVRPPTPIRIEVYPRHEDFSVRTVGLVGVDIVGVCFGPVIALDSPSAGKFGPFNWASALWHEVAHTFHLAVSRARVPRWFTEGLAVHEEHRARPGWGMDVTPGFLAAFREGRLAPASDMNRAFLRPSYPDQVGHTYYEASLAMALIEQRRGFAAITGMLQRFAEGGTTAQSISEVLGMRPEAFDAAFNAYVRSRFGESLEGLFPAGAGARYPDLLAEGHAALAAGALDAARSALERALAMFPDHAGPGSPYRLLASVEEKAGDPDAAIRLLTRNIAIDADDLAGHRQLARLHLRGGNQRAAIRVLERALLIQPFDPAIHRRLAGLFEARGEWGAAMWERADLVALSPVDEAGARYRLARAMSRADRPREAHRQVLRALEIAPMYEEALELLLAVRDELAAQPRPERGVPPQPVPAAP